jgi:hypothetical protein
MTLSLQNVKIRSETVNTVQFLLLLLCTAYRGVPVLPLYRGGVLSTEQYLYSLQSPADSLKRGGVLISFALALALKLR